MWTDKIFRTYPGQNIIDTHRIPDRPSQVLGAEYNHSGLFMSLFPTNFCAPEIWKLVQCGNPIFVTRVESFPWWRRIHCQDLKNFSSLTGSCMQISTSGRCPKQSYSGFISRTRNPWQMIPKSPALKKRIGHVI
jgi:hypothetical protein